MARSRSVAAHALEPNPMQIQPDDALADRLPTLRLALEQQHRFRSEQLASLVEQDPALARPVGSSTVPAAAVVHAVREEMAIKLTDVVLRRTQIGTEGHPGEGALQACAALMGRELGWDGRRIEREIEEATVAYPPWARAMAPDE